MNKSPGTSTPTKPIASFDRSPNQSARNSAIKRIILHYTTSRNLDGVVSWFKNPTSTVSAHYVIATNGEIVQMVSDDAKAWHTAGNNNDSIGIEICAEPGDRLTGPQTATLTVLLRWLLAEYHLKPDAITAHGFVPGAQTSCPGDLWKTKAELDSWVRKHVANSPEIPDGSKGRIYAPCPVPIDWPTLERGIQGASTSVFELQCALIALGYLRKPGEGELVGDVFNEHVENAVRILQQQHGLDVDGIVGPQTRSAIERLLTLARRPKGEPTESVATLRPSGVEHNGAWVGLKRLGLHIGDQTFAVASGARGAQTFRRPTDPRSVPGNLEPIPQGTYSIGAIEFANGKDNYEGSWGNGLGPVWVALDADFSDDRDAFGFHLDANIGGSPGSAGCVVFRALDDLKRFVAALREHGPKKLVVDWGIK